MPRGVYERVPVEERFWSRVEKTETCWLWRGGQFQGGYEASSGGRGCRACRTTYMQAYRTAA